MFDTLQPARLKLFDSKSKAKKAAIFGSKNIFETCWCVLKQYVKKVIYLISFGGILIFQYHSFSPISLLETNFVACNTRRCSSLHKPTSAYEYLPRHFSPLMPLFLNRLKCACMCYQLSLTLVVVVSQSIIVLNTTQRNN